MKNFALEPWRNIAKIARGIVKKRGITNAKAASEIRTSEAQWCRWMSEKRMVIPRRDKGISVIEWCMKWGAKK